MINNYIKLAHMSAIEVRAEIGGQGVKSRKTDASHMYRPFVPCTEKLFPTTPS